MAPAVPNPAMMMGTKPRLRLNEVPPHPDPNYSIIIIRKQKMYIASSNGYMDTFDFEELGTEKFNEIMKAATRCPGGQILTIQSVEVAQTFVEDWCDSHGICFDFNYGSITLEKSLKYFAHENEKRIYLENWDATHQKHIAEIRERQNRAKAKIVPQINKNVAITWSTKSKSWANSGPRDLILASDASFNESTSLGGIAIVGSNGSYCMAKTESDNNNQIEFEALCQALKNPRAMIVVTDSMTAIRKAVKKNIIPEGVVVQHVRGHTGFVMNEMADSIARFLLRNSENKVKSSAEKLAHVYINSMMKDVFHHEQIINLVKNIENAKSESE